MTSKHSLCKITWGVRWVVSSRVRPTNLGWTWNNLTWITDGRCISQPWDSTPSGLIRRTWWCRRILCWSNAQLTCRRSTIGSAFPSGDRRASSNSSRSRKVSLSSSSRSHLSGLLQFLQVMHTLCFHAFFNGRSECQLVVGFRQPGHRLLLLSFIFVPTTKYNPSLFWKLMD